MTEWGMKFPEDKREAAKEATKLKRFATVEVGDVLGMLARVLLMLTTDRTWLNK